MNDWRAIHGELHVRRFDVEPLAGGLEALHRPTVIRDRGRVLVVLSVSAGIPQETAAPMLGPIGDDLVSCAGSVEPAEALGALREEVWRQFQAGRFDRALPDILALVTDDAGRLRVWRAGPNGVALITEAGVRLVSEDLRFAALQRMGATLAEQWSKDPLLAEISELTQIEAPHAAAQELAVDLRDLRDDCLLLLSRGALPFAAPPELESIAAWWDRDAGWRHGMGATVVAIAGDRGRRRGDAALAALEQRVGAVMRARFEEVDRKLSELHRAARTLITGSPTERQAVASQLSRQGGEAWDLLATLAQDGSLAPEVRLAAADAMTAHMPRGLLEPVAISLLEDEAPALRGQGIMMSARLYLDALEPLIRRSFEDDASFRALDVDVSLANLARAASQALLAGRPAPDFPDWATVAMGAPPPPVPETPDDDDDDVSLEYLALRQWLLRLAPEEIGGSRPSFDRHAFGLLMETGYPQGTHTLACLVDGTVHNHLSNGLLDQGLGRHDTVRAAAEAFLDRAQRDWHAATPATRFPRPAVGMVRFFFLGPYEVRVYETTEQRLHDRADPLTDLYLAGHAVLSEIHVIELGLEE